MMRAAIIGGGVIGGGWAARFLLNGWDVSVFDPDPQAERKINEVMANARRSLPGLSEHKLPEEGMLQFCSTIAEAVTDAAWIQESVPEQLPIKHKVMADIQTHCLQEAVIASSTSGFKPSELQEGAKRPKQICVAHPFNPVYLLPLIELVGHESTLDQAALILTDLGMKPLKVRKEIDAHIADRFLEAVWREGLWLIKDGISTTQEIDDAIRFGFGLRWGQMGLFETYRIAGGEEGMAHFIRQFGPCLSWPWTKLMDVPDLTEELIGQISDQSDAQSGMHSIRELERIRDDNLVAMMRALKGRDWGAGEILNQHDARIKPSIAEDTSQPLTVIERSIPIDWTDYNGHMNESRYGQLFSDAADAIMVLVGADPDYIESGYSYFTVDNHIRYLSELNAGDQVSVTTQVLEGRGKKLRLFHRVFDQEGTLASTCTQMLIHVSLETRRSCDPLPDVLAAVEDLAAAQDQLPTPDGV